MAGKQVDATRQELFITLKYLLDNCYDEKHTSKTVDLMNYAKEHYSVLLDRRRVNGILEFLAELPNTFPDILPFAIKKVDKKPRYYIEKAYFNKQNAKKISQAIFKDSSLSAEDSKKLVNIFLNKVCNPDEKEKLLNNFNKKERLATHPNQSTAEKFAKMDELIEKQASFFFRPKARISHEACSNSSVVTTLNRLVANAEKNINSNMQFIEAMCYTFTKDTDVCLFIPDLEGAVIIDIENIFIKPFSVPFYGRRGESFELRESKYSSIDEMIDLYYEGGTGLQYDIHFKYVVGLKGKEDKKLIEKLKSDYKKWFNKVLDYTLEDRDLAYISKLDGQEKHVINVDLHGRIRCNLSSFTTWYWEHGWFEHMVIVEPKVLNNRILEPYISRFTRRLEKYGETPEEREARIRIAKERREELLKRIKERREHQAANNSNQDGGN